MKATPKRKPTNMKKVVQREENMRIAEILCVNDGVDKATREAEKQAKYRWWIARSHKLPEEHRNGWVLSVIVEEYVKA